MKTYTSTDKQAYRLSLAHSYDYRTHANSMYEMPTNSSPVNINEDIPMRGSYRIIYYVLP